MTSYEISMLEERIYQRDVIHVACQVNNQPEAVADTDLTMLMKVVRSLINDLATLRDDLTGGR